MSEYNKNAVKLLGLIQSKPFIFPKDMIIAPDFPSYFNWFEKNTGKKFHQLATMVHFHTDILDVYKNNIVWTGYVQHTGGGMTLQTLVQCAKDMHILFLYSQEEQEVSLLGTLYVHDTKDFIEFVTANRKYWLDQHVGVGFKSIK